MTAQKVNRDWITLKATLDIFVNMNCNLVVKLVMSIATHY